MPDLYKTLVGHAAVERVVALSGGYSGTMPATACRRCHGIIASFSRALVEGLSKDMSDEAFDAALGTSVEKIYTASTDKA